MRTPFFIALAAFLCVVPAPAVEAPVDLGAYHPECGITVKQEPGLLQVVWPMQAGESGDLSFNLDPDKALVESVAVTKAGKEPGVIARQLDPITVMTVGERDLKPAGWMVFFDNPPKRPHASFLMKLNTRAFKVSSVGSRVTVSVGNVSAGSFAGDLRFTFYRNGPIFRVESVMSTKEDARAFYYDTGLTSRAPDWQSFAWRDTAGMVQRTKLNPAAGAIPVEVVGRTMVAEGAVGSLAVFPAPHQFFYPQDEAFNLKFVWHGSGYHPQAPGCGLGIRQSETGDGRYVPWINGPPNTEQRLAAFYLVSTGSAERTLGEVADYTHGDKFKPLPGYLTFTSHYHVEHTQEFIRKQDEQKTQGVPAGLEIPGFVKTFKARGVNIAHLAEFHFGETPGLRDAVRLPKLKKLHQECERLSDESLLVLPGEEPNVHLGGHWISLFPKPVYWVLSRPQEIPFVQQVDGYGTVYHVGNADEVLQLMEMEKGLMWTAHARIKSSQGFPDRYKDRPFYHSDRFLGAAWKAMPADLSRDTLGWRVLDLQDDSANWGHRKQTIGEVDTFRMETNFETYGHMNINYLKLDKLPKFAEGWQPVLDALRGGRFFVSTGEILIPEFSIGGKESGSTVDVKADSNPLLAARIEWTFPLAFAQVISGDGKEVSRQRIDLSDTEGFGARKLRIPLELKDRTWVRFEVWDIAANGAFTQPVWLTNGGVAAAKPAPAPERQPATWARFVPERKDDFAWENDLVAFRTYGPAIRPADRPFKPGMEDSGIDCWTKRVRHPIIDKWYKGEQEGVGYHQDHGEGCDAYGVGSSRGCGGTAIWSDGRMILSGPFKTWKLVSRERDKSVFELTYQYDVNGQRIDEVKRITIELGRRLFRSESTFTKDSKPAVLEIAIGITTHEGRAKVALNAEAGWMSCWEKIDGSGLGTGVVIDPKLVASMNEFKTPGTAESHALLVTRTDAAGRTVHYAGFGWEKAGEITSPEKWQAYLSGFAGSL